jgi:microcystin-dependent protein
MNDLELTGLAERLRRIEEALEAVPRAPAGGGGWRETVVPDADKDGLAVGDLKMSGRVDDHTANAHEWLLCDGRALSRAGYAALFTTVGTAFGPGDGSTTFNIPKLTTDSGSPDAYARFPVCAGGVQALGAVGGAGLHTHTGSAAETGQNAPGVSLPHSYTGQTGQNSNPQGVQSGSGATVAGSPHAHDGAPLQSHSFPQHTHPSGSITVNAAVHLPPCQAVGFFILAGK